MARVFIVNEAEGDRTPFLRGVLVQSLVTAGMSFQDAYVTAQAIRDQLDDQEEITSTEFRTRVANELESRFGAKTRQAYEQGPAPGRKISVRTTTRVAPFSVGILAHSLEACAVDSETAWHAAKKVQERLLQDGRQKIDHKKLRRITYHCLSEHCSDKDAARYLSWRRFEASGQPLILLIGGASGVGKSTIASEFAYRLESARTQSTDMMRQIIRCYLAPNVVPTLAFSSFEAWRGLPVVKTAGKRVTDSPVIAGFLSQFATVKVAVEATIQRAIEERHHLIVDGVHVVPTELDLQGVEDKAIVVPVMLAVMGKKFLAQQLKRRGRENPRRGPSRHRKHLDAIWDLQSYLLTQADSAGIPIIPNTTVERMVGEILDQITQKIMERYPPHMDVLD